MLNTVWEYIHTLPDIPFEDFYQNYIFRVQDMSISIEVDKMTSDDIVSLKKILTALKSQ